MTTYYLATNGDDGDDGSLSTPWATFSHAQSQMVAGDLLLLRGGDYTPTPSEDLVEINVSGTSSDWVEFKAYDAGGTPEEVWIDGQFTYPSAVQLAGVETQYGTSLDTNYKGLVTIYANYVKWTNIGIKNSKGVLEPESVDPGTQRWHHITVSGVKIHDIRHAGITTQYVDYLTLQNIELTNCGHYAAFLRPVTVLNHPAALKAAWNTEMILDGVVSYDNWGEGINCSQDCVGYIVRNCRVFDTMGPFLYLHRSRQGEVYNNIVYNTPAGSKYGQPNNGIYVNNEDPKPNDTLLAGELLIYNNLVVGTRQNFFIGGGRGGLYGFDNIQFFNNTLINATQFGVNISARAPLDNIEFWNNLIYQGPDADGDLASIGSSPEISMQYNAWSAAPTQSARGTGDQYGSLNLVNPDVVLSQGGIDPDNYKKKANSTAIFAGVAIPEVTVDFYGGLRNTPPDIGFDEFDPVEGGGGGGGGGTTPVALSFGVAQGVAAASTGTTTLTDSTFGDVTPKAALVLANKASTITSGRAEYGQANISLGVTDGTTEGCVGMRSRDAQSTTSARARAAATKRWCCSTTAPRQPPPN